MTMFKKIAHIVKFGSFRDFDWDASVLDKDGKPAEFKKVNILYGRNYSGKTTLSRIFRALEKGKLPANYKKIDFTLEDAKRKKITAKSLGGYSDSIRVFNIDFVKDNLQVDPGKENDTLKSFSIALGEDTATAENQLAEAENKLGAVEDGKGLLWSVEIAKEAQSQAYNNRQNAEKNLKARKTGVARDIRHNAAKYGKPDYQAAPGLDKDINAVTSASYSPLDSAKKTEYEKLIVETQKSSIELPEKFDMNFDKLAQATKNLVEQKVLTQVSIQELVDVPALAKWVEDGMSLHAERKTCGFCHNPLTETIWDNLKNHFNQESEDLKGDIESLLAKLDGEVAGVTEYSNKSEFASGNYYSRFHAQLDDARNNYENEAAKYSLAIGKLKEQLEDKAGTVSRVMKFQKPNFDASQLLEVVEHLRQMTINLNNYSAKLADDQQIARKFLRLDYVAAQIKTGEYQANVKAFDEASRAYSSAVNDCAEKQTLVEKTQQKILELKTILSNESAAARKVNDFLSRYFANNSLVLESDENLDIQHRFVVKRGGEIAHNLSEGERNIIAFCYFVARLHDGNPKKPYSIIWIDDPVSSLDSNHIFLAFGLIRTEILDFKKREQVFLSTHNLDFLKCFTSIRNQREIRDIIEFFFVERPRAISTVTKMPEHLKNATEFNYLFKQIHTCAFGKMADGDAYQTLQAFGNSTRQFLEIFLYYRYPNTNPFPARLSKFFEPGEEEMEAATNRLINEASHMGEQVQRGERLPIPSTDEAKMVARFLLKKIYKHDRIQYKELWKSIRKKPVRRTQ